MSARKLLRKFKLTWEGSEELKNWLEENGLRLGPPARQSEIVVNCLAVPVSPSPKEPDDNC